MKDVIDRATWRAILFQSDGATRTFYEHLRERRFQSTRCRACGRLSFPPRPFCPRCGHGEVEWADLPREGRLHAFTQQQRALRFFAPEVIGQVELPEVGFILSRIDASFEALRIDQPVTVDFYEISPELVVHQFRPV